MTTPATPSTPQPAGDDRNLTPGAETPVALSFEEKAQLFWDKNRGVVLAFCGAVLLAAAAKGGWEYYQHEKDLDVQQAYAAATTTEQLKSFAAANSGHALAGVAQLRIADEAYAAGKAADALAAYEQAIAALKDNALVARAKLGRALAKALAGKTAEAETDLKQLAADTTQFNAARAEATYHLASLAAQAGQAADVQKYSDQLMQIDPTSLWTQRAMMLRASLPASAAPTAPEAKKDDSSSVQIKLPGK